ncbi:MAG: hypothetical protein GC162_11225 [Planctomycetes bacterium]|nr:hypothetical protein [Planctomycetota bacterium]
MTERYRSAKPGTPVESSPSTPSANATAVRPLPSAAWGWVGPVLAIITIGVVVWVRHDTSTSVAKPYDPRLDATVANDPLVKPKPDYRSAQAAVTPGTTPERPDRTVAFADTPRLLMAENAKWAAGSSAPSTDGPLPKGPLVLEEGRIEFVMPSGVHVTLEGNCAFETTSENSIRLDRGTLSADVPDEAVGFFVQTPSARVTAIEDEPKPQPESKPATTTAAPANQSSL